MMGRTEQKEGEPRKARPRVGCLLYKVLITCKGLFVIAEFKILLPYINKRPECPKPLAWSVFKMCLHVGDSDPSWRAVSLWNGRGGTLNLPVPTLAALIMARKHLWGSGRLWSQVKFWIKKEGWLWEREWEFIMGTFGGFHIEALN